MSYTVTWTDSVQSNAYAVSSMLALANDITPWLLDPEERFVADFNRRGWNQSTGLARENPATAIEDPEWHPWDRTREDIGWWWLWEEDHECW